MNFIVRPESVPVPTAVKHIAYGNMMAVKYTHPDVLSGRLFRVERIHPRLRQYNLNNPISTTPQFRAQTLYTLNTKAAQIPATSTTVGRIIYPTLAKL